MMVIGPLKKMEALFASDIKARRVWQLITKQNGNPPLWMKTSEEWACIMLSLPPASFPLPHSPLSDSHKKRRGGIDLEEITLLLEYAFIFASTVSEQPHLNRGEWVCVCFFTSVCGRITDQEWERKHRERKCAALRRAIIIHQTPAAFLLFLLLLLERDSEQKREREQQRESERVTLTSQQRRDVKRRIHKGGEKILLSLLLPLSAHPTGDEEQVGIWLAYIPLCFPAVSEAVQHCAWSAGRAAAESLIGDISPQQKKSTVEKPGCLTTWPIQRRGTGERKARVSNGTCHVVSHSYTQIYISSGITMHKYCVHLHIKKKSKDVWYRQPLHLHHLGLHAQPDESEGSLEEPMCVCICVYIQCYSVVRRSACLPSLLLLLLQGCCDRNSNGLSPYDG